MPLEDDLEPQSVSTPVDTESYGEGEEAQAGWIGTTGRILGPVTFLAILQARVQIQLELSI